MKNREIKFRGKRVDNGEWVHGDLLNTTVDFKPVCSIVSWKSEPYTVEVIPETVGQFIGIKDKNENEIYEGHKVKDGNYKVMLIEFDYGSFGYYEKSFNLWLSFCSCYTQYDNLEIIED